MSKIKAGIEKGYEVWRRRVNKHFNDKPPRERLLMLFPAVLCVLISVFFSRTTLPYTGMSAGVPLVDAFLCSCNGFGLTVYAGAIYGGYLTKTLSFARVFVLSAILIGRVLISKWIKEDGSEKLRWLTKVGIASLASLLQCLFHLSENGIYEGIWRVFLATLIALPVITAVFSFFFSGCPQRRVGDAKGVERALYEVSTLLFFMAVVYSMKEVRYFGISLSSLFALVLALICAAKGGMVRGGITGLVLGWVCAPSLALSYGATGISAGIFYCLGVMPAAGVSAFVGSCTALFQIGYIAFAGFIPETVMAVAAVSPIIKYSLLPKSFPYPAAELPAELSGLYEAERRAMYNVKENGTLLRLSETLSDISDTLQEDSGDTLNTKSKEVCRLLTDRFCDSCALNSICWETERESSERTVRGIVKAVTNGNAPSFDDSGDFLSGYCVKFKDLREEIGRLCDGVRYTCAEGDRVNDLYSSFKTLSEIIKDVADRASEDNKRDTNAEKAVSGAAKAIGFNADMITVVGTLRKRIYAYGVKDTLSDQEGEKVRKAFSEACKLEYSAPTVADENSECLIFAPEKKLSGRVSVRKSIKEGEECSGDSVMTLETDDGYLYAFIADGMGSGEEARRVSETALLILKKLFLCKVKGSRAAKLASELLRRSNGECFTTLDVLEIDLVGGNAVFLKNGAAASYVIRNGAVYCVSENSMPLGTECEISSAERTLRLCDGDTVVMMSDGIAADETDGRWVSELACCGFSSGEELCEKIMSSAMRSSGQKDDKTVLVIELEKRSVETEQKQA